ncbi:hypothetical protein GQ53DRAFT_229212 [Thozetella sp. PMI_491]|nr:hypothetical protein GQ53DRAFT_229212 [Thozetella sp. PMI_491]
MVLDGLVGEKWTSSLEARIYHDMHGAMRGCGQGTRDGAKVRKRWPWLEKKREKKTPTDAVTEPSRKLVVIFLPGSQSVVALVAVKRGNVRPWRSVALCCGKGKVEIKRCFGLGWKWVRAKVEDQQGTAAGEQGWGLQESKCEERGGDRCPARRAGAHTRRKI